jgi:sRNA-binding protein
VIRPAAPAAPPAAVRRDASASEPPEASGDTIPATGDLRTAFLANVQRDRPGTLSTVLAQARSVDVVGDRLVITVATKFQAEQVHQAKSWLESVAQRVAGRRIAVVAQVGEAASSGSAAAPAESGRRAGSVQAKDDLLAAAKASHAVQTLLEIFPAEITDVTELKQS